MCFENGIAVSSAVAPFEKRIKERKETDTARRAHLGVNYAAIIKAKDPKTEYKRESGINYFAGSPRAFAFNATLARTPVHEDLKHHILT
ncbi:hypothetical protein TrLO_g10589 [Triparma laevis f. longispina]|uniref:Uncharacterized protein n=1 Tax=Triparma laevis f. longispina TaxID=1714387 RepID=A0A9W7AQ69_9STRA|nr:hypothetical protein TrLO_g10589 [Triparma laevis f. longispina]